jgi:hypothetical protein
MSASTESPREGGVRDPLADRAQLLAARQRPMSERLALALSWNAVVAELRTGLATVASDT